MAKRAFKRNLASRQAGGKSKGASPKRKFKEKK